MGSKSDQERSSFQLHLIAAGLPGGGLAYGSWSHQIKLRYHGRRVVCGMPAKRAGLAGDGVRLVRVLVS